MIGQIIVPHIYKETSTYTDRDTDGAFTPSICHEMKGKKWEQWQIFFCWSTKSLHMVTAAMKLKNAYSLEEKFLQPRQHIGKQRHAKCCLVKAMVFPRVKYGCKSWTIKEAECRRTDAFELWCWRRLLRVPWTAKRSNQSILKKSGLNIHWKDWC